MNQPAPAPTGEANGSRAERERLGTELRRLRELAGLSGRALARQIRISQSKLSRIEAGAATPAMPTVAVWADAVDADAETRDRLAAMTRAAFTEIQAWRSQLAIHHHLQGQIALREAQARQVRVFQPSVVPGLLQTAEYARRVFGLFHLRYTDEDLTRAIAARLDRQLHLYSPERTFAFLITEAALRWRPAPAEVMRAQLDRIFSLSTLENVSVGLVPLDAPATIAIPNGFDILEDPTGTTVVSLETLHANLFVTDVEHLGDYARAWSALSAMSLHGDEARTRLTELGRKLG